MLPATESSFDVAYWFIDRALDDHEYLQPQKLHRLLYLSQAYFAVAYKGRMLMPAVFVATELGPIEPGVFRALEIQRPPIENRRMPPMAIEFLDSIWRRFGAKTAMQLSQNISKHAPYVDALSKGENAVISLESMIKFYGTPTASQRGAPGIDQIVRPKAARTQSGKVVSVQKWMPPVKK